MPFVCHFLSYRVISPYDKFHSFFKVVEFEGVLFYFSNDTFQVGLSCGINGSINFRDGKVLIGCRYFRKIIGYRDAPSTND